MKSLTHFIVLILALASLQLERAAAKKSSASSSRVVRKSSSSATRQAPTRDSRAAPVSRRRTASEEDEDFYEEDADEQLPEDEDDDQAGEYSTFLEDEDVDEDDDDASSQQRRKPPPRASTTRAAASRKVPESPSSSGRATRRNTGPGSATARKRHGASSRYGEDEYDEVESRRPPRDNRGRSSESYQRSTPPRDRRRPPPPGDRRGSGGRGGMPGAGSVVPYGRGGPSRNQASAFSSVIAGIRSAVPDTDAVRTAALSSLKAARETTSSISSNLYREVKGLTSSELEQVMLKATRPDDSPVKGKHVERLVGVTYQISARYDIYDAVLRKLWSKMAEKDWRTTIKALYILHRFSADGAPDHAPALKARLRELRRTRDPKRKDKYFNTKQLMAGDSTPDNGKFRAFMQRYAHYVLLRAQCFGGMFDEIGTLPRADKKGPKPITSTSLRPEHLEAAGLLLKAGVACQLKDGEECENTAIAAERVASDLIGLTTAVAIALNRALKDDDLKGANPALLKRWCQFYADELQPQTKAMVKKTSPKLDAFGLFLPSRMGTSVSRDLLDKGLSLEEAASSSSETKPSEDNETADAAADGGKAVAIERAEVEAEEVSEENEVDNKDSTASTKTSSEKSSERGFDQDAVDEGAEVDEEYEYEEEDYYDEEE